MRSFFTLVILCMCFDDTVQVQHLQTEDKGEEGEENRHVKGAGLDTKNEMRKNTIIEDLLTLSQLQLTGIHPRSFLKFC